LEKRKKEKGVALTWKKLDSGYPKRSAVNRGKNCIKGARRSGSINEKREKGFERIGPDTICDFSVSVGRARYG